MKPLGIVDVVSLAATLLFAVPIGLFGLTLILEGRRLLGLTGVAVALGLVLAERYLWSPEDAVLERWRRLVERVGMFPPEDR